MHAIYRQNFGFTDIIIGRKHADAPYEDGKDIWDGLAAQRKFDDLKGELKIQPVKVGFAGMFIFDMLIFEFEAAVGVALA